MRAYLFVAILLLTILGSIGSYQYLRISRLASQDFTPPPVTVAADRARLESWTRYLEAIGTIKAARGVELTAETSGEITRINFRSGDRVELGQELVVLNDEVEQATRQSRVAGLHLARLLYDRDQALFERKSLSEASVDRSLAALAQAEAQLDEIDARLRNKRIVAPFTGTIGIRRVDVGDYLAPGTPIATLQDLGELEIDFALPAQHLHQVQPGQRIELAVAALPEQEFSATLQALDSRVDPDTMNLMARARIEGGDGLLPGMFATLKVVLGQSEDTVTVPETAITYSLQGSTIFVLTAADDQLLRALPRVVQTGEVRAGRAAILGGLAAGERVVTAGQNKLYRGARVRIDSTVRM